MPGVSQRITNILREEELYAAGRAVETAQAALEDARRQAEVLQKEGEIDRITCESERSDKEKSRAALQEILDNGDAFWLRPLERW